MVGLSPRIASQARKKPPPPLQMLQVINEDVAVDPPPGIVTLNGRGSYTITPMNISDNRSVQCPETHFRCPANGYCLPVFLLCNGVHDCPGREDEEGCSGYRCPGFYRCRASTVCLHPSHVCDGVFQCPQHDDELLCDLVCPEGCLCYGHAFTCNRTFLVQEYPDLRYLDARESGIVPGMLKENFMLIHLSLARCALTYFGNPTLLNLRSLDLSDNRLTSVFGHLLRGFPKLEVLSLAGNPLASVFKDGHTSDAVFPTLTSLDLSGVVIKELDTSVFESFPNIQWLNLSNSRVEVVLGQGFQPFSKLSVLDTRGCPMSQFPKDVFAGLDRLRAVFADNYKLCCPATLPQGFSMNECQAPFNEISSCDALLRSDTYRIFLSVFAILALVGNLSCFVARVFVQRRSNNSGFGLFVTHLSVSDFLMGVYLAIIGVADSLYQGTYLWEDNAWRSSAACTVAGFLSLLSSEVSAFFICLITLDRFLVLRFPLHRLHFRQRSAQIASLWLWIVGLVLASVPLLPVTSHWEFYSQTGICIPLPVTRNTFEGQGYVFGIMIVLNFVLFLLIAAGQAFIYASIRANSISAESSSRKSQDLSIARRLITIAMSDFLCWFPIGLLGLLAAQGILIPGEVSVGIAIFVLPLNSALNPFLYTLNMVLERRRLAQEEKMMKVLITTMGAYSPSQAMRKREKTKETVMDDNGC